MATPVETGIFINTEDNHSKSWRYDIVPDGYGSYVVKTAWGRVGTRGQVKDYSFGSQSSASYFAQDKADEKIRKGYKKISENELKLAQLRGEIVGGGAKVEHLDFVKPIANDRYDIVKDIETLANPEYKPIVVVMISLTAGRGTVNVLMTPDETFVADISPIRKHTGWQQPLSGTVGFIINNRKPINKHPDYDTRPNNLLFKLSKRIDEIVGTLL